MKKNFFFSLLLPATIAVGLLSSCSKNDSNSSELASQVDFSKIVQLKNLPLAEQRIAFNLLTPDERYYIWSEKLSNLSKNEKNTYNAEQLTLINELKNNLSPKLFDTKNNADSREIFKHTFAKTWTEKAQKLFTPKQMYDVYFSINGFDKDYEGYNPSTSKPLPSCNCNVGSKMTCLKWKASISFPAGGTFELSSGNCTISGECLSSSTGCGGLFMYSCNGNTCS